MFYYVQDNKCENLTNDDEFLNFNIGVLMASRLGKYIFLIKIT